jgi:hypothetical protein
MNWCGDCSGFLLGEPSVEEQDPGSYFSVSDPLSVLGTSLDRYSSGLENYLICFYLISVASNDTCTYKSILFIAR